MKYKLTRSNEILKKESMDITSTASSKLSNDTITQAANYVLPQVQEIHPNYALYFFLGILAAGILYLTFQYIKKRKLKPIEFIKSKR